MTGAAAEGVGGPRPEAALDAALLDRLRDRYATPPRRYHTFDHATVVARHAADLGADRACLLAAWFHDAVYDVTGTDNEERSALLLLDWLSPDVDASEAARLVRVTADHVVDAADRQAAILCDADLAVLGADPTGYEEYRRAVRAEYVHVSDGDWRAGRAAVLRRFLERDRIYRTAVGHDRWEAVARRNLADELAGLTGPPDHAPG